MFDSIRVEAALPDPAYQDRTFQTKSLDCTLSDYTITRDGNLVVRQVELEAIPSEELPDYGTAAWERGGVARFAGRMRTKSVQLVTLDDFHGDIVFYDIIKAPDVVNDAINLRKKTTSTFEEGVTSMPLEPISVYYKARFTDGKLQWIRSISAQEADTTVGSGRW